MTMSQKKNSNGDLKEHLLRGDVYDRLDNYESNDQKLEGITTMFTTHVVLALNMMAVVGTGSFNTITRKMALTPLEDYVYFLSQMSALSSTLMYSIGTAIRYRTGHVTKEMLQQPKLIYVWIGLMDALGEILGHLGARDLRPDAIPLLAKINIPISMALSYYYFKSRYSSLEYLGVWVLFGGFLLFLIPSWGGLGTGGPLAVILYLVSVVPTACGFIMREKVFRNFKGNMDVFVVGCFVNVSQLCWTILLIPTAAIPGFGKVPFDEIPDLLVNGFVCFSGTNPGPDDTACDYGTPAAPLAYIAVNLSYNLAMIFLLKNGGTTLMFITNTVTFTLGTLLTTLFKWPLFDKKPFTVWIIIGLVVELAGVVLYRLAAMRRNKQQQQKKEQQELLSRIENDFDDEEMAAA